MASMRPSDITDGNVKRRSACASSMRNGTCFNEAVGYYRRKLDLVAAGASMRPSDITAEGRSTTSLQ